MIAMTTLSKPLRTGHDDKAPQAIGKRLQGLELKAQAARSTWVCLKIVYPIVPNGFADHYPYEKLLFHWEYTLFSDKPT